MDKWKACTMDTYVLYPSGLPVPTFDCVHSSLLNREKEQALSMKVLERDNNRWIVSHSRCLPRQEHCNEII
jgi:hypothetical protein